MGLLHTEDYLPTLGALSGAQAVQMVKAGAKGSTSPAGRSRATNLAGDTYPDQSSIPRTACRRSCAA